MSQEKVELQEGETYAGIITDGFTSTVARKMQGRRVRIDKIYKRMGAEHNSYRCTFLAKTGRQKDYEHTFNEKNLAELILPDTQS